MNQRESVWSHLYQKIAKDTIRLSPYNFGAQFYSDATIDANSVCEGSSGQGVEEARNKEQEGGHSGSTKRQKETPLCYTDGHLSLKKAELETKFQKYKGRLVLRGDIVKDDSGAYAVFY